MRRNTRRLRIAAFDKTCPLRVQEDRKKRKKKKKKEAKKRTDKKDLSFIHLHVTLMVYVSKQISLSWAIKYYLVRVLQRCKFCSQSYRLYVSAGIQCVETHTIVLLSSKRFTDGGSVYDPTTKLSWTLDVHIRSNNNTNSNYNNKITLGTCPASVPKFCSLSYRTHGEERDRTIWNGKGSLGH